MRPFILPAAAILMLAGTGSILAQTTTPSSIQQVRFSKTVANVEYGSSQLSESTPDTIIDVAGLVGAAWHGQIIHRSTDANPRDPVTGIPFVVEFEGDRPVRAWCDQDVDGQLADEPPLAPRAYPAVPGAVGFLATLKWTVGTPPDARPIERIVRLVVTTDSNGHPTASVQLVHAMVGTLEVDGQPHRAFLFDGNGDGVYGPDFFDGIFVDLDDDRSFSMTQSSPEFGPLAVPFQMGRTVFHAVDIEPSGSSVSFETTRTQNPVPIVDIGRPAPGFAYDDIDGQRVRLADHRGQVVLLSFWASWCGNCASQAPQLVELVNRHDDTDLAILGISYDTQRDDVKQFRQTHGVTWPTSFSGHMLWEDPVARLYQSRAPGTFFVIDREGRLDSIFTDTALLADRVAELLATSPPQQVSERADANPGS